MIHEGLFIDDCKQRQEEGTLDYSLPGRILMKRQVVMKGSFSIDGIISVKIVA